jgi:hypothetical protein
MDRYKYPRTYHLPWSPGKSDDDKVLHDLSKFEGQEIVITEKMDGENTTIYPDGFVHARSMDSNNHKSRDWIKQYASTFAYGIEENYRICGENLYAKHSIEYDDLESYFYMFSVWVEDINCGWDLVEEYATRLGVVTPRVLYRGEFDLPFVRMLHAGLDDNQEGFVMRLTQSIHKQNWSTCAAKWVRPDHVQSDEHWMHGSIVKNRLRGE